MDLASRIASSERGLKAAGKRELLAHLNGKVVGRRGAMFAKCFDCMGGFPDGRQDCACPACPLYPWMPYNPAKRTGKQSPEASDGSEAGGEDEDTPETTEAPETAVLRELQEDNPPTTNTQ